jgi:hypothetical protein
MPVETAAHGPPIGWIWQEDGFASTGLAQWL